MLFYVIQVNTKLTGGMTMKRWMVTLGAMLLMPTLAAASGEMVSVSELREQVETMGRWQKTYQAQGRTVEVDIPIIVPEVEGIPILKAQIIQPMTQERIEQAGGAIQIAEKRDTLATIQDKAMPTVLGLSNDVITYYVDDGRGDITLVYEKSPTILRNSQKLWSNERCFYPDEVEAESCYAEENPMSLAEAERYLNEIIGYFYGETVEPVAMDYVSLKERARRKGETRDSYPMGTYEMHFSQCIDGVPILGVPFHLYDAQMWAKNGVNLVDGFAPLGTMKWFSEIMDKQSFFLHVLMLKKTETIPCGSFTGLETVLSTLEKKIEAGRIRNVYALRLGYICYLDEDETYAPYPAFDGTETYVLYPMWICECEYVDSPKARESEYAESGDFRTGTNFKKVGIDAQTGKLLDPTKPTQQSVYPPKK